MAPHYCGHRRALVKDPSRFGFARNAASSNDSFVTVSSLLHSSLTPESEFELDLLLGGRCEVSGSVVA